MRKGLFEKKEEEILFSRGENLLEEGRVSTRVVALYYALGESPQEERDSPPSSVKRRMKHTLLGVSGREKII